MKPWAEHITVATTCNLLVIRAVRRHVVRFADPPRPGSQIESGQMSSAKRVVVTGGRPFIRAPPSSTRTRLSYSRDGLLRLRLALTAPNRPLEPTALPSYVLRRSCARGARVQGA